MIIEQKINYVKEIKRDLTCMDEIKKVMDHCPN